jgi:hypothetical protein
MTAQVGDGFVYKGMRFSIVARTEPLSNHPMNYGIMPKWACTACWAGYYCGYVITDDALILDKLCVNSSNGEYPEINGRLPDVNKVTGEPILSMGHHVYRDLGIKTDYTGKILLGKDFISKYYIHMGYQRPWAYETLVEFEFKDGRPVNITDVSDIARELRRQLEERRQNGDPTFRYFSIGNSFSLDYEKKAWWLK